MKTLKILFVHHRGVYLGHLVKQLDIIRDQRDVDVESIMLDEAVNRPVNEADVLIYHTFPDEGNLRKFNEALVKKADRVYDGFKGIKILFDSFNNGRRDAFTRFYEPTLPRIKCDPHFTFLENFNVVHEIFTDYHEEEVESSAIELYELLHNMVYPPETKTEPEPKVSPKSKPKKKVVRKAVKKTTAKKPTPRKLKRT